MHRVGVNTHMWSSSISGSGCKVNSFTNPFNFNFSEIFFLIYFFTIELFLVTVQLSKWQCCSLAKVLRISITWLHGSLEQLILPVVLSFCSLICK